MKNLRWLLLTLTIVGLDQLSKSWITSALAYGESKAVTGFFNLVHAHNKGAAFSFLSTANGWQHPLFIAIAVTLSVVLIIGLLRTPTGATWQALAIALILGGALGNLWDRVTLGYVIDFLDVYIQQWHWPAFNVADSAICIGVGLLFLPKGSNGSILSS